MANDILTTQQAADFLNLHRKTVYKLAKARKIPCKRIGNVYRFSRARLEEWLGVPRPQPAIGE